MTQRLHVRKTTRSYFILFRSEKSTTQATKFGGILLTQTPTGGWGAFTISGYDKDWKGPTKARVDGMRRVTYDGGARAC